MDCSETRIVYYTRTCFLDAALQFIREMSRRTEMHVLLEISPDAWQSSLFDVPLMKLPSGVVPADSILQKHFPAAIREYWNRVASFNLIVHNNRRSIHPSGWKVSHSAVKLIRELKPDLIHFDDTSLRFAFAYSAIQEVPAVLSLHDPAPHSGEHDWRTDVARRFAFKRCSRFVLHSRASKKGFCRIYRIPADLADVIPLGVYEVFLEWIERPIAQDDRMVLFFGRLSQYKGLEVLYSAAPMVAARVNNVHFVIAGRPAKGYRLPASPLLPNMGLVEVIDEYITNRKLAELFQQAAVVVCPYNDATQSGVILTAYAFGKPVVATSVGGLAEYVKNDVTGCVVPPQNANDLAAAIVRLLEDPAARRSMSRNIQRSARAELSWSMIAEQANAVYRKALYDR